MRIVHPSAKGFAKALESVWNIVDEANMEVSEEGIKIMAIDPGQISMVVFSFPKEVFMEYEVSGKDSLGLNFNFLKKILKRGKSTEMIVLEKETDNLLKITFQGDRSRRSFRIPLVDVSETVNREPPIEYNNYVKMMAEPLKDVVKDASIISNYIKFTINPNAFEAEAESESGDVREVFEEGSEAILEIKAESGATAMYPLEYLDDILKPTRKGDAVTLYMETDKPLRLEYNLEGAFIRYYLAPRLEVE